MLSLAPLDANWNWNANVGHDDCFTRHVVDRFGLGLRCTNGRQLRDFADVDAIVATRTFDIHGNNC